MSLLLSLSAGEKFCPCPSKAELMPNAGSELSSSHSVDSTRAVGKQHILQCAKGAAQTRVFLFRSCSGAQCPSVPLRAPGVEQDPPNSWDASVMGTGYHPLSPDPIAPPPPRSVLCGMLNCLPLLETLAWRPLGSVLLTLDEVLWFLVKCSPRS